MNETAITVHGRLTADPVVRRSVKDGTPMATFRIASNARKRNPEAPGGYEDGATSYYSVVAFRSLGANSSMALSKGDPVVVSGNLEIEEFTRPDGSKGSTAQILAQAIGHDLTWGVTMFRKVSRGAGGEALASDPRVQAATSALAELAQGEADGEHPAYDYVGEDGSLVDSVTGEVREDSRPAA